MTEATIICPNCRTEIPLTQALAALPVATVLRHSLQQVSMARAVSEGQHTKTALEGPA